MDTYGFFIILILFTWTFAIYYIKENNNNNTMFRKYRLGTLISDKPRKLKIWNYLTKSNSLWLYTSVMWHCVVTKNTSPRNQHQDWRGIWWLVCFEVKRVISGAPGEDLDSYLIILLLDLFIKTMVKKCIFPEEYTKEVCTGSSKLNKNIHGYKTLHTANYLSPYESAVVFLKTIF